MSVTLPNVDSLTSDKPLKASKSSLNGAGVLIVDEDPAFQLGLKTFLKDYVGFKEVFTARSGAEALQLLENEDSIEVVTLDYQMPGMNGIEVLRRLNAEPPHPLSVLMITGYPSDELEEEFQKLGNAHIHTTHFLSKPVEFEELERLVLDSHAEMKAAERLAAAMAEEEAQKAAQKELPVTPPLTPGLPDPTGPISPIAAAALFAHRDPTEPIPVIETSNPEVSRKLDELSEKVGDLEKEVARMADRTPSVQERFWMGILKIILLAAVVFGLFQFGVIDKISSFLAPEKAPPPAIDSVIDPPPGLTEPVGIDPDPDATPGNAPSPVDESLTPDTLKDPTAPELPEPATEEPVQESFNDPESGTPADLNA